MNSVNKIHIALADDQVAVRKGIKSLLEEMDNYEVSLEASNGLELITQLKAMKTLPDICIIDVGMGPLNGYETMLVIKKKWPQLRTIIFTAYNNELLISKMLRAGASAYLARNITPKVLNDAINSVLENGCYYTGETSKVLLQNIGNNKGFPEITKRELQFLHWCCCDLTNKEIADRMGVATRTVENYCNSLFRKFDKHTRTGLTVYAIASGLIYLSTEYLESTGLLDESNVLLNQRTDVPHF